MMFFFNCLVALLFAVKGQISHINISGFTKVMGKYMNIQPIIINSSISHAVKRSDSFVFEERSFVSNYTSSYQLIDLWLLQHEPSKIIYSFDVLIY